MLKIIASNVLRVGDVDLCCPALCGGKAILLTRCYAFVVLYVRIIVDSFSWAGILLCKSLDFALAYVACKYV